MTLVVLYRVTPTYWSSGIHKQVAELVFIQLPTVEPDSAINFEQSQQVRLPYRNLAHTTVIYLSVFMKSAIALACSSSTPAMPLL